MDTVESASFAFDCCFAKLAVYEALKPLEHEKLLDEFNDISIYCTGWKQFDDMVIQVSKYRDQVIIVKQLKEELDKLKINMWNHDFKSFSDFAVKSMGNILMKSMQYAMSTQKESLLDITAENAKHFISLCKTTKCSKDLISCLVQILQNAYVYNIAHDDYSSAMRVIGDRLIEYTETLADTQ